MIRFSIFFLFFPFSLISQMGYFKWPLDIDVNLTGNYGELRPNHFHAGFDFSTNNKINYPVKVAADGYISRIKVSPVGYGKALYVTHPNGKVTVYGHMTNYAEKINRYVKEEQYRAESFDIELFPKPDQFEVKAGEVIGFSGNSGSSGGPHLHFEIRDEKTEVPLNPALYYPLNDTEKPVLERVALYNLGDTASPQFMDAYPLKTAGSAFTLKKDSITVRQSIIGIAFSGYDLLRPKGNKNNIYSTKLYVDSILIYEHALDGIAFSEARYVNEFSDVQGKHKFQRCFVPTLYPKGMYKYVFNKGRVILLDTNYHQVKMVFADENKNEVTLRFYMRTTKFNYYRKPSIKGDLYAQCDKDVFYDKKKLQIFISAGTLYNSTPLIFENTLETTGKLIILPTDAKLNTTAIVGFEAPAKFKAIKNNLLFRNADNLYLPIVHNDSVFYSVKNFGWFQLAVDTVAPSLKTEVPPAKFNKQKNKSQLVFVMRDELSGIKSYRLLMNQKWVLAEYDAKTNRLIYFFDEQTPKGKLLFKLEASDKCGNRSSLEVSVTN